MNSSPYPSQGFHIFRNAFMKGEIETLRAEVDRISKIENSACVRHLREKSEPLFRLATSETLLNLLPTGLTPVRSILFDKNADVNWPVAWHQDLTICLKDKVDTDGYGPWSNKDGAVHVQPPEALLSQMLTLRIHLDDTPNTNGALQVIPGSHNAGKIPTTQVASYINDSEVTCECNAGDILLMSPLLLHASNRSEKPKRRRIIHFEYAPINSLDNKLSWYEPQIYPA